MKSVLTLFSLLTLAVLMLPQTEASDNGFAFPGSGEAAGTLDVNGVVTLSFVEDKDGFSKNDWLVRGKLVDNQFTGLVHVHFVPAEYWKQRCPGQWETSLPMTAVLQEDGKKWVGSYTSPRIADDCTYHNEEAKLIRFERNSSEETTSFHPDLPPPAVTERPARLWILLSTFSAPVGTKIPVAVVVAGKNELTVVADRDIPVQLKSGEQVSLVVIRKGQSFEIANVGSNTAGFLQLEASASGLEGGTETLPVCDKTVTADDMQFSYTREEAPADGKTPIPIMITFQNIEARKPASGNQQKAIQVLSKGVGIWTVDGHTLLPGGSEIIDKDHCAIRREVVSTKAGTSTVIVSFGTESKEGTFRFVPYLDWLVFSWITCGALAGASIRIWQRRRKGRTWTAVIMQFFIGCMAGVVVFLAFYFGMAFWPTASLPASFAADFLIGFIGGFLGAAAIKFVANVFTDRLKPGDHMSGQGKSSGDAAKGSASASSA